MKNLLFFTLCLGTIASYAATELRGTEINEVDICNGTIEKVGIFNGGLSIDGQIKYLRSSSVYLKPNESNCMQINFDGEDFETGVSLMSSIGRKIGAKKNLNTKKGEGVMLFIYDK